MKDVSKIMLSYIDKSEVPTHVGYGKDRSKALLWRHFYVLWDITISNACKISQFSIAVIKRDGAKGHTLPKYCQN